MPLPIVYTAICGPMPGRKDSEQDTSAESDGVFSGIVADSNAPRAFKYYENLDHYNTLGLSSIRMTAVELPISEDVAGVAFPAGSMLLIGGHDQHTPAVSSFVVLTQNGTVLIDRFNASSRGWFWGHRLLFTGVDPATVGTITIQHRPNWAFSGTPFTTIMTLTIDGANGRVQEITIPSFLVPNDPTVSGVVCYASSWTGASPLMEIFLKRAGALEYAVVVPSAPSVDWTLNDDSGELYYGSVPWQPTPAWHAYRVCCPAFPAIMLGFTRGNAGLGSSGSLPQPAIRSTFNLLPNRGSQMRRFGQASAPHELLGGYNNFPCLDVGGLLMEHPTMPWCNAVSVDNTTTGVSATATPYPMTETDSGWTHNSVGPGWRAFTAWAYDLFKSGTITFTSVVIEFGHLPGWVLRTSEPDSDFIVDGSLSFSEADCTGSDGTRKSTGGVNPPAGTYNAHLYTRMVLKFSRPSNNGSYYACTGASLPSPRCDIPAQWPAAGPADYVPGGYDATILQYPEDLSNKFIGVPGDTSGAFATPAAPAEYHACIVSFVPPTTGVWKAEASFDHTAICTHGEYENHWCKRLSQLCRGSKRMWGSIDCVQQTFAPPATWTFDLVAITQVSTSVSGSGRTILSAHLTGSNWAFYTIAASSPGTYDVILSGAPMCESGPTGPSIVLAASQVDSYAADPEAVATRQWWPAETLTGGPTTTPPGSPSDGQRYIVGIGATGAWAGEDGNLATWSRYYGEWQFIRPNYSGYGVAGTQGSTHWWINPGETTWTSGAAEICRVTIAVETPGTIYVRVGKNDPDGVTTDDSILSVVASPRLDWTYTA